jgi:hypothetical protein
MSPQSHNDLGLYDLDLPLKKGQATDYLVGPGIAIFRRAAFQDVAYEHIASLEPAGGDDSVQQLARPADKGTTLGVLVGAGGLPDEHYSGVRIAFARNGIGPGRIQAAFATLADFFGDFFKVGGLLCDSHFILLIFCLGCRRLASQGETREKLIHLEVLANNPVYVYVIIHCSEL